ncbi:hypothetical protein CQA63_07225 [Helicobacter marmotae]|uniref:Pilus assembly protein PilN n=2 Tax=Helicobacter marmotae TaxID=152490 RepID=A0A3D8I2J3_9HELI|nr:hypothetical protein CQA63_07225 [Helicobacter marmotae]
MIYSFIRPKPKSIFKRYTKIWFAYSVLAVLCVLCFAKILEQQESAKIKEQARIQEQIQYTKLKAIVVKDYIERLDYEVKIGKELQLQNQMLKDGLSNLLKLIPDQITTRSIELDYNMLILKGLTPSKEVYKFLLEAPLRAVFTQTKVEFYPLVSGWFNFMSISKANPALKPLDTKENQNGQ